MVLLARLSNSAFARHSHTKLPGRLLNDVHAAGAGFKPAPFTRQGHVPGLDHRNWNVTARRRPLAPGSGDTSERAPLNVAVAVGVS